MHLQSDDSLARDGGVVLAVNDSRDSVETQDDAVSHGANDVAVPTPLVERAFQLGRRLNEDLVAAAFVVEAAPVFLSDVGLVPRHFAAFRDALRAELNPRIAPSMAQAEFQPQFEITEALRCRQKLVPF